MMAEWAWNYFSSYRGSRLITGERNGESALRHPQAGSSTALQRNPGLSPNGGGGLALAPQAWSAVACRDTL